MNDRIERKRKISNLSRQEVQKKLETLTTKVQTRQATPEERRERKVLKKLYEQLFNKVIKKASWD
jgi:predicted helicase